MANVPLRSALAATAPRRRGTTWHKEFRKKKEKKKDKIIIRAKGDGGRTGVEPCQEDQTEERLFTGLRRVAHTPHAQPSKSTHSSQTTGFTASGQTEAFCQSGKSQFMDCCTFFWVQWVRLVPFLCARRQLIACFLTREAKDLHLEFFCCYNFFYLFFIYIFIFVPPPPPCDAHMLWILTFVV